MATTSNLPADAEVRERALALDQSFIVRAPAGSGKTDLLIRRFLKLLAAVDEPEEILAITFTRAATAEMRSRVLGYLEKASRLAPEADEDERISLARAALAHSEARGWRLLEQPHRLNIETIDSLCLRIAQNQPLLSRMGGRLSPSENAWPLYAEAARRTLSRMGSAGPELDTALAHLLELRDNNLAECERLIAEMLSHRDQWVRAFPLSGDMGEEEWSEARSRLQKPFRDEVKRVHGEIYALMMEQPMLGPELVELAQYACGNGNGKIAALAELRELPRPEAMAVEHWRCIAQFLLTNGEWRKPRGLNVTTGFPPNGKKQKARMGFLLEKLAAIPNLREVLCEARDLPELCYEQTQWKTLRHIFVVLRHAVAGLRVLFAERDTVDFTEVGLAAREVLGSAEVAPDALLALSGNLRHFLVDEFQDTSRSQHDLLRMLIRAWDEGDGRTCFLVGDPMQSIYLFRQAEVELFEQVVRDGLVCQEHTVELEPLKLVTNFRSHKGLTARWNQMFDAVFGGDAGAGRIRYSHTFAWEPAVPREGVKVYPQILGDADGTIAAGEKELALEAEAEQVLAIIDAQQARIHQAIEEGNEYRVAVLVRSRPHLARITRLLREREVPFRAVELEKLSERQELIDLMSLVRALLHPMDRVAWLSVLRAPWCGLRLSDLHALTGADDSTFQNVPALELIQSRNSFLSADGAARLERVSKILRQALAARFEGPHASSFSQWIERTWRSLGGPQCVEAAAYENAQAFFVMLDAVTPDGMECLTADFEAEMERLYAQPDPRVSERAGVQLMTIHKAKGLGFDVVIVPGLDRRAAQDTQPLICSLERTNSATGEPEMLVVPIGYRGDEKHPTYAWVRKQLSRRADEELKRLLYVACTRARRSLHLLGTATLTKNELKPDSRSLLGVGWPALQSDFEEARRMRESADEGERSSANHEAERGGNVVSISAPTGENAGLSIAAAGVAETEPRPKLWLRRLPTDFRPQPRFENVAAVRANTGASKPRPERPHGSRDARQKGSVVHALLEQLSRGVALKSLSGPARSLLRGFAYSGKALEDGIAEVLAAASNCVKDADGAWILASHTQARSEISWTGWKDGSLETLRADRVFIAGAAPRIGGSNHLWIIDYKMSAPAGDEDFLVKQRAAYAPQLARYAQALRDAEGIESPVCFGLYYPRIPRLDWWSEAEGITAGGIR